VKELYMTKLLNTQRMQQFKPIRARETAGLVRSVWDGHRAGAQDVRTMLQSRACDLVSRMVLGRSFDELAAITRTSGPEILGTFYEALGVLGEPDITEFLLSPLHRLNLEPRRRRRAHATFRRLDAIFQSIIDHRRDSRDAANPADSDLLDTLLTLRADDDASARHLLFTDDDIKAIFWVLFPIVSNRTVRIPLRAFICICFDRTCTVNHLRARLDESSRNK
jgi:cytochrome P450